MTQSASSETIAGIIVEEIDRAGWTVRDDFVDALDVVQLGQECRRLWDKDRLRRAGVGVGRDWQIQTEVRSDRVMWLDPGRLTPAQDRYCRQLESLRLAFNRAFYLGLFEYEGHFAVYPPGAFYRRHLDQFHGVTHRRISVILYLNTDWDEADGGALRIYLGDDGESEPHDVAPLGGRLVVFQSDRFHHEVLPARAARFSLTGWLRTRA